MLEAAAGPGRVVVAEPLDEQARLDALRRYQILDTPPDGAFDHITALAAAVLHVPIAIVSIVDEDRIWLKSHHGLEIEQIDRGPGLCASAIMRYEPLVIADARLDPLALTNPLVAGEFGLRFYAAAPLTTADRHNLGTLCIIDTQPRDLAEREIAILCDLAALVVRELELRLEARTAVGRATALHKQALEERRNAVKLAETLRRSLLPPSLPSIPGIELAARSRPFDESLVGGDFYDVFPLTADTWGVVVGDVCGKGPPAAALSAAARHTIRATAVEHESPAAALQATNHALTSQSDGLYCTLLYARLRLHQGAVECVLASGGHPLPRILRRDGTVEQIGTFGTIVGALADAQFHDANATLNAGDTIIFFTDGLTEAITRRTTRERIGEDGLDNLLRGCHRGEAHQTADCLEHAARHTRDDLTILVAQLTTEVGVTLGHPSRALANHTA